MKHITNRNKTIHQIIFISLIALLTGCGGATTKEDVNEDLQDANEAIQEATEATEDALESKKDYHREHHEEALIDLEKKCARIEKRISEFAATFGKYKNNDATVRTQATITALQLEKVKIDEKIKSIKSSEKDWNSSYDDIISSITSIEADLEKLSKSLEQN